LKKKKKKEEWGGKNRGGNFLGGGIIQFFGTKRPRVSRGAPKRGEDGKWGKNWGTLNLVATIVGFSGGKLGGKKSPTERDDR